MGQFFRGISDLRDAHAQTFQELGVEFPQIVTVGAQSSGKTSFLETLMNLQGAFPTGEDQATLCPVQIRFRRVSLRSLAERHPTGPAGGVMCSLRISSLVLGAGEQNNVLLFQDRMAEAPAIIRAMHDAVAANRLQETGGQSRVDVREQALIVEYEHPDIVDLNVLDLPGLVVNENQRENDDILALQESKIGNPSNLIIAVCDMMGPPENVQVLQIIRTRGAAERTICCVTRGDDFLDIRTDRRVRQNLEFWARRLSLSLAEGTEGLGQGWFCVINLASPLRPQQSEEDILSRLFEEFNANDALRQCFGIQRLLQRLLHVFEEFCTRNSGRYLTVLRSRANTVLLDMETAGFFFCHLTENMLRQRLRRELLTCLPSRRALFTDRANREQCDVVFTQTLQSLHTEVRNNLVSDGYLRNYQIVPVLDGWFGRAEERRNSFLSSLDILFQLETDAIVTTLCSRNIFSYKSEFIWQVFCHTAINSVLSESGAPSGPSPEVQVAESFNERLQQNTNVLSALESLNNVLGQFGRQPSMNLLPADSDILHRSREQLTHAGLQTVALIIGQRRAEELENQSTEQRDESTNQENHGKMCIRCLGGRVTTTLYPCAHGCFCDECYVQLVNSNFLRPPSNPLQHTPRSVTMNHILCPICQRISTHVINGTRWY